MQVRDESKYGMGIFHTFELSTRCVSRRVKLAASYDRSSLSTVLTYLLLILLRVEYSQSVAHPNLIFYKGALSVRNNFILCISIL